jgi:peptidoglycan-N-acetylglucosamine deacetylase
MFVVNKIFFCNHKTKRLWVIGVIFLNNYIKIKIRLSLFVGTMFAYFCNVRLNSMNHKTAIQMFTTLLFYNLFFIVGCNEPTTTHPTTTIKKDTLKTVVKEIIKDSNSLFEPTIITYDTTKKYVYLTFDDGPQSGTTACVEVCKKLGMKATFFMVGEHASSPNLKQIVKNIKYSYPLLLLANHSTTHAHGKYHYFYNHEQMAANDFYLAQKTLNVPYKIIRLPGNTSWVTKGNLRANKLTKPVCKILDSVGYNVIGWDVEWNFNRHTAYPVESPEKLMKVVNNAFATNDLQTKNHLVILTHDRMFRNKNHTDSLTKFIALLQQNKNYVFETLDHYPGLKKLN